MLAGASFLCLAVETPFEVRWPQFQPSPVLYERRGYRCVNLLTMEDFLTSPQGNEMTAKWVDEQEV